ncbi:hypothetical protein [Nonomuraea sp. GTA35]|uniref:hypothetical protein n=1 Tax=Nonomuraea sp. GTA35 TaxID=1676746 RepID=UPI0035BF7F5B
MTRVEPNSYSPYATAAPDVRHLFAMPAWLMASPRPGELAQTACGELAVVPDAPIKTEPGEAMPEGMCGTCVKARNADVVVAPSATTADCSECGLGTCHGALCALCRTDLHDQWRLNHNTTGDSPEAAMAAGEDGPHV